MEVSTYFKLIAAGLITTSLTLVPLTYSAQAQDTAPGTGTEAIESPNPLPDHTERENENDLGWFGLIGLAGLAGLAAKKHRETVHTNRVTNDPDVKAGSNYR